MDCSTSFASTSPPALADRRNYRRGLALVLTVYCALYGGLLVHTDAFPYVLDNNESFSSLWHAHNLYHFGVSKSYGLTDETFAYHTGAHPYVHTHQGNFPRVFAFLIFVLGARTIESQIVVTTFTVGLAALFFAYHFFCKVGNPLFSTIACLFLMTDYLLFSQWQVNTYRVWHGFFFFSSLLCVHGLGGERRRLWCVLAFLNYLCLFYFEFTFVTFVTVLTGLYAAYLYVGRPAVLFRAWGVQALGAAAGVAILFGQLAGYMGVHNVLADAYYTVKARNFGTDESFRARMEEFYDTNHIVCLPNVFDAAPLRKPSRCVRALFSGNFQVHTPAFALVSLILWGGWLAGLAGPRLRGNRLLWLGVLALFYAGVGWLVFKGQHRLYNVSYGPLWKHLLGFPFAKAVVIAAVAAAVAIASVIAVRGTRSVLGEERTENLAGLVPFFAFGLVAFVIAYVLFTGYVMTGYLGRCAPFLVFLVDVVPALGLYCVIRCTLPRGVFPSRGAPTVGWALLGGLAGLFLCGYWVHVQTSYFRLLPPTYFSFLKNLRQPPFHGASFVCNGYVAPVAAFSGQWAYCEGRLKDAVCKLTESGYEVERHFDDYLGPRNNAHAKKPAPDRLGWYPGSFLWLADKRTNPDYLKPDYFLYLRYQYYETALERVQGRYGPQAGASEQSLIARAASGDQDFLVNELVSKDPTPADRWAIVRLDWDYPPYLAALGDADPEVKVRAQVVRRENHPAVAVEYRFAHQEGRAEQGSVVRLYRKDAAGSLHLVKEYEGVRSLDLPDGLDGNVVVSVTPRTATKAGPEYFSPAVEVGSAE